MGPINFPSGKEILAFLIVIFCLGGLLGWGIVSGVRALSSDEVITDKKIEPIGVQITTIDGVADTTYIYERD